MHTRHLLATNNNVVYRAMKNLQHHQERLDFYLPTCTCRKLYFPICEECQIANVFHQYSHCQCFPSPICIIKNHYNHIPITNPVPTVGYYGYTQGHSHMLVTTS